MERIGHSDAEIFLAGIQIFGPDPFTAGTFRRSHDHAIVEVQSVGSPRLNGA